MGKNTRNSMRASLCAVFLFIAVSMVPQGLIIESAKAEDPPLDADWPMFRFDMNRTGNTTSTAPNMLNLLWTHQVPKNRYSWGYATSPAVVNNLVYVGSRNPDSIRAIDAITGIQSWATPTGGQTSSPTVANGHVLFGSYGRDVYSIMQDTGAVDWRTPVGDWVDSSPVVHDGKVYIGSGIGDYVATKPSLFYCLDEIDGNIIWTFQAGGQIVASPTVVNNQVIFGSYDENIYALPIEDPNGDGNIDATEVIWTFHVGARVVSSAAVQDGMVYVGALNGKLYALPFDDPDGDGTIDADEVIWTFTAGNEVWSSPGIANGRVIVGSHDYSVYSLPKEDPNQDGMITANEVIWEFRTTDKIWSSPSIAGGKVFIGSEDYTLWALSEETGELIWNYVMPVQTDPYGSEYLYAQPSIVEGRVYIGNFDLTLYCLGIDDDVPPGVTSVSPANNTQDVPLGVNIEATFNEELTSSLITESSLILQSSTGEQSTGQVTYDNVTNQLVFNPDEDLLPDESYTVRLVSRYLQDSAGNPLDGNGNGVRDADPLDDYVWYFNTSKLVGSKPWLEEGSVTPQQGYVNTVFEFSVVYYDEDGDAPVPPSGFVWLYVDGIPFDEMTWANDTNTPQSYLLDRDYTNGELFHLNTQLATTGNTFHIECFDGSNTNRTPDYPLPTILNSPPDLDIPTQYVQEDEEHSFSIAVYAQDIDNGVLALFYGEDSEYCQVINGHFLSCLYTAEDMLSEVVRVLASDGTNQVWQDVLFIISLVDDPPTLKPGIPELPPATVHEDTVFVFELDEYVTDPDTPLEQLETSDNSENMVPVGLDLYIMYPEPITFERVLLSVSDGSSVLQINLDISIIPGNQTDTQTEIFDDEDVVWSLLMILLVAIIVLLFIINIWIYYRRRDEETEPDSEETPENIEDADEIASEGPSSPDEAKVGDEK